MRSRKYVAKIALTLVVLGAVGSITVAAQDKATSAQDKATSPHNKMTTAQDKAATAQDKYTIAVPGGLAFSEFQGYEGWQLVSISHNGELIAAILANPLMIDAYRAGIPGNGQPFPDGAKMAKIHWKPTAMESFPTALVPDVQHDVDFMVKDSKRFADSGGWDGLSSSTMLHLTSSGRARWMTLRRRRTMRSAASRATRSSNPGTMSLRTTDTDKRGGRLVRYSVSPPLSGFPAGWLRNVRSSDRRTGRA
jgi:hypothetical protein